MWLSGGRCFMGRTCMRMCFFFSSRRRHTRCSRDWSSDVCSSDLFGRYTPALNRFPSAAGDAGFTPLADYVHRLGLKFGIHILRGIPKRAMKENLPIAGSPYHAAEAANTTDTCPWNYDNYGVDASKPAGQAYYDSITDRKSTRLNSS